MRDRICLVTGAGRGIGRAIALRLAAAGARVAITARSRDQLESLGSEIDDPRRVLSLVDDLAQRSAPERIVSAIEKQWGPVQVLVNNAGIGSSQNPKPLVDFDDDFWDLTMQVNVTAPYLLTKRVLPGMLKQGFGRIINIASINAKIPPLHGAAYAASKHAVAGLTKATALEVAGKGITANAICPGVTATRMNDLRLEYDAQRLDVTFEELEQRSSPIGRRLVPDEVAAVVVFLAQDEAGAVNGQAINVCGGLLMC
jgi:NAD(P)-dependent dehydrogenase (short-subunit alcohol dehydrogenase family)